MRFSDMVKPAVRFGAVINPTMRFGALMYPMVRFGTISEIENPTVRFGGVFKNRECYCAVWCFHVSYGGVRCGLNKSGILRCGSVRFSDIVNPTVRLGTFSDMVNLTVRFCAVINATVRFGAVPR